MASTKPMVLATVGLLGVSACGSRSGLADPFEEPPPLDASALPDASLVDASVVDVHPPDSSPDTPPPDAPPPLCEWSRKFGVRADVLGIDVDGAGNVILGGRFQSSIDFGSGPISGDGEIDGFIAKLDTNGNVLWSHIVADTGPNSVNGVAFDGAGNVVALVTSKEKSRLVRYDPSGNALGSGLEIGTHYFGNVVVADDGTIVVSYRTVIEKVVWLAVDPTGTQVLWQKTSPAVFWIGTPPKPLAVANGRAIFVGSYVGAPDFGGGPLPPEAGTSGSFAVALDLQGNFVFSTALDAESGIPTSVSVGPDGKIWIASHDGPTAHATLLRLDADGHLEFSLNCDAQTGDVLDMDVGAGGVTLAAGVVGPYDWGGGPMPGSAIDRNVTLTQFDSSAKYLDSRQFGGSTYNFLHVAVRDAAYVVGSFSGSIDFGQGPLTTSNVSLYSFFVAKCPL